MILSGVQVFERAHRVAPLGVRFRDEVTGAIIQKGLRVTAFPVSDPSRRTDAAINSSGAFFFSDLPGLRNAEFGAGDDDYWKHIVTTKFIVDVFDADGRFQPFSFDVDLPYRGLYDWTFGFPSTSPPSPHPARPIPLYTAPARLLPSGVLVIRAELFDPVADAPAPFAVLEARVAGETPARGVADLRGRVAVVLPVPRPIDFASGGGPSSPAAPEGPPITSQVWTVKLSAFFSRPNPVPAFPNLKLTLGQPAASLWSDSARGAKLPAQALLFGQELILRTRNSADATLLPQLYITPGI